jgi:predicted nucleotidyltransferase
VPTHRSLGPILAASHTPWYAAGMKPPPAPVLDAAIRRLRDRLVAWGATKIILYGSAARGDYTATSDIDLLVIKDTPLRLPERIADALEPCAAADPPLPVEPLVYTPEEFSRLTRDENPLVLEALRHGRVLYDAA